jgi:hypothetical protein
MTGGAGASIHRFCARLYVRLSVRWRTDRGGAWVEAAGLSLAYAATLPPENGEHAGKHATGHQPLLMTRLDEVSIPKTEFDTFLYARLGEDLSGSSITVLSLLARQDVDPWDEAAALARMNGEEATRRLGGFIASSPAGPTPEPDAKATASRLLRLLPKAAVFRPPSRPVVARPIEGTQTRAEKGIEKQKLAIRNIVLLIVLMACLLGGQWLSTTYLHGPRDEPAPVTPDAASPSQPKP